MVLQLHPTAKKIVELIEPHVERQGFELVGIDFRKGTRTSLLRLLVDRPGGGIAMSDLEVLSPIVSDLLDVYDPVEGRYLLEVASPGVNRPLTKLAHFEPSVGQRVKVRTHRPHNGRKNFEGVLAVVSANGWNLMTTLAMAVKVLASTKSREQITSINSTSLSHGKPAANGTIGAATKFLAARISLRLREALCRSI